MPPHPFDALMEQDENSVRLAEAALLFAADHDRSLDPAAWLARLDDLGRRVAERGGDDAESRVAALRTVLVHEEGLAGNTADYYDPRNSFLHEVLSRRTGIPISLGAIWLDVADQLGWPFVGVGFPGHFLIKHVEDGRETIVDPFHGGRIRTREECAELLGGLQGMNIRLAASHFAPAGPKSILTRMLNNLNLIYVHREAWSNAARVLMRLRALHPQSVEIQDQLALVAQRLTTLN